MPDIKKVERLQPIGKNFTRGLLEITEHIERREIAAIAVVALTNDRRTLIAHDGDKMSAIAGATALLHHTIMKEWLD